MTDYNTITVHRRDSATEAYAVPITDLVSLLSEAQCRELACRALHRILYDNLAYPKRTREQTEAYLAQRIAEMRQGQFTMGPPRAK